jgi:heat shock protein HtpX
MTAYTQVSANRRKTFFLMFLFGLFTVAIAYIFSIALGFDPSSAIGLVAVVLFISTLINVGSYFYSDRLVMSMARAKQIKKNNNPKLFRIVENLSIASGAPIPKVFVINDAAPNAFATGRNPKNAAIAVTTGLLEKLDKLELEGVISHELSHVQNYDTRVMTIVVILVGLIALLSHMFIRMLWFSGGRRERNQGQAIFLAIGVAAAILAPIAAQLIKLAVSRKREYLADASGAILTRNPDGLANALEKISSYSEPVKGATTATAHLYISNPLGKEAAKHWLSNLFNTHPPIQKRIKILRNMQ